MIQNRKNGCENQITWSRELWNEQNLNKKRRQRNGNRNGYDSNCHGGAQGPL